MSRNFHNTRKSCLPEWSNSLDFQISYFEAAGASLELRERRVGTIHLVLECNARVVVDGPVDFIMGFGGLLPGIEAALQGKRVGDTISDVLSPDAAYGQIDPRLDLRIPVSAFPVSSRGTLVPGVRFEGPDPRNPQTSISFVVLRLDGDFVVATANHPLAGRTINYRTTILAIRDAEALELEHRHVHGPRTHTHEDRREL